MALTDGKSIFSKFILMRDFRTNLEPRTLQTVPKASLLFSGLILDLLYLVFSINHHFLYESNYA